MRYVQVLNVTRQRSVLGNRIEVAETHWQRTRGLLGRPAIQPGQGMMLTGCRGVHTWGMRYRLDIIMLDRHGRVVRTYSEFAPWRVTAWQLRAAHTLELPAGTITATTTQVGDTLVWLPADGDSSSANGETTSVEA